MIATFRLTERPGPGTCGSRRRATARQTAFEIDPDGKIRQWRRVVTEGDGAGGPSAPSTSA